MKNFRKFKNIESLLLMAKYDEEFDKTLFNDSKSYNFIQGVLSRKTD